MSFGQIVLLVYALLMLMGGMLGSRAGARASLYAGSGAGTLLLVALGISAGVHSLGLWMGTVIALLLAIVFLVRLMKTGKFMPAGMLLVLSVVAALLLVIANQSGSAGQG